MLFIEVVVVEQYHNVCWTGMILCFSFLVTTWTNAKVTVQWWWYYLHHDICCWFILCSASLSFFQWIRAIFTHISSSTKLWSKNRPITLVIIAATCYLLFPAYGLSALLSCPQNNCEISEGWAVYFFPLKYHASGLAAQVVVHVCEIMSL